MLAETPIEIAGKHLILRYSTRDLLRAEAALETPVLQTLQKGTELSLQDMSTLIQYGLKTEDRTPISYDQYMELLDLMPPADFIRIAADALGKAFSASDKNDQTGKN